MILRIHRWVGLGVALFWLLQALTGVLIVFRWEIDDATVAGARVPVDPQALGLRIEQIVRERGPVASVWSSSRTADRFDIDYTDASGVERMMRVDGAGRTLRDRPEGSASLANGAIFDKLTSLHTSLLAGTTGSVLIGISGVFLLTSLALGLRMAWPRGRHWTRPLLTRPRGPLRARLPGWHRVVGLWGALPAVVLVTAGVVLAFQDDFEKWLGVERPTPDAASMVALASAPTAASAVTSAAEPTRPGEALALALVRHPGAKISALIFPAAGKDWYRIRLHSADELSRNWGVTTVFVSASGGALLDDQNASSVWTLRGLLDFAYPLHTGQVGGWVMRVLVLALGAWLMTMIWLGVRSWMVRR